MSGSDPDPGRSKPGPRSGGGGDRRTRPPADRLRGLLALPWVLRASLRAAAASRGHDLGTAVAVLRRTPRPLPRWLRRPEALAGAVEVLLPVLPPRRYGPCLRRALILLDLWTRCGLRPVLHMGVRAAGDVREGHAWVTAGPDLATDDLGHAEAFRF